ncbi:uncharacterized protein H6S33_000512 [Morchella sextelata]|uniref:uncharacterized protein n=1 Tax=Morchella sextelata TaxID=1174677 RepID=UPI001D03FBEA|nr:uncharacterized protein H6S33_000512 [Morchella sextelata]KAH0614876.1 hypothetical protein H6S33_000512 [Morchella sextelata]
MQGFNMGRYVPPEHEGVISGNKLNKKKPSGFHGNTQTVRFEMPFNIFCLHCDGHIAQGVRFNAEKKKIGKYYSTPIFSFRMKHSVCSGWIEIQTDPKNTAYVAVEGAKKQAAEADPGVGVIRVKDPEEISRLEDPFAKAEKKVVDKTEAKQGAERIAELQGLSDRQWQDPYEYSRKMRKIFRAERKELQEKSAATEAIRERAGLAIELLDEIPEDAQKAKLIEFGPDYSQKIDQAHSKPLFPVPEPVKRILGQSSTGKTKAQTAADTTRERLQTQLRQNTRARVDPFLHSVLDKTRPSLNLKLLKRKQADNNSMVEDETERFPDATTEKASILNSVGSVRPGVSLGLDGYESE